MMTEDPEIIQKKVKATGQEFNPKIKIKKQD